MLNFQVIIVLIVMIVEKNIIEKIIIKLETLKNKNSGNGKKISI